MDLKQIEYIVKIDDEHSITRAAEKLFVTQSALNQQLLRLEKSWVRRFSTAVRWICAPPKSDRFI